MNITIFMHARRSLYARHNVWEVVRAQSSITLVHTKKVGVKMKKKVKLQAGGRITIPKSFRQKMNLKQVDKIILEIMKHPKGAD
jgi:DNA-binding transcriptional regulator/RsmH inhibitor MraZ